MSTGIANLLEEENVEGYVGLTLAAMYEASLGAESVWSAYLALLANRTPAMASDLPEDARELMKKCEAYADIETDLVSGSMRCIRASVLQCCVCGILGLFSCVFRCGHCSFCFCLSFPSKEGQEKKFKVVFVYTVVAL